MTKPLDISQITDYLYISAYPHGWHSSQLIERNIRLILSMHWFPLDYILARPPLSVTWLPSLDNPFLPIPMVFLERGVKAAKPVIDSGQAVLTHCHQGRHRSVAMACCVLISQGLTSQQSMDLVKQQRTAADPDAPYIRERIRLFEERWSHQNGSHG